jgi:hypothetical protein
MWVIQRAREAAVEGASFRRQSATLKADELVILVIGFGGS